MNIDEVMYSLKNLLHRQTRSWLTIISILIGIAAIFALISFGLGINSYVNVLADEMGRDKIFITAKSVGAPGTDPNFFLTKSDIDVIEKVNGIKTVAGLNAASVELKYKDQKAYTYVAAFDAEMTELIMEGFTVHIVEGRNFKRNDDGKIVLGYAYQIENRIFNRAVKIGDKIELNGNELKVIGFYSEIGSPPDDSQVYITTKEYEKIFPDRKDQFSFVMAQTDNPENSQQIAQRIKERLRKHKGQEEGKEDFFVQTFQDYLDVFNRIISTINGVLILIALISVVVASVNIMNTMYTAVLERTKEIGVMKAIGAKKEDIAFIFIFESGFLGLVGGILGIGVGYLIAYAGGSIAAATGYSSLQPIFPWYLIAGCLLFAFSVGAFSGFFPALRAANLKPVDALRYE